MVDAITTQVVRNRIGSLMQEMHYHFYRSGYSTIIRESRDFSCVILDHRGGLLVAPPMFFHAPVYRHLVTKIFERHGNDVRAGDMFVCNHPYEGGLPHVSDMAFVAPIMVGDTLVGFAGSIAHKADVGGTNPGSTSANATEIFQEGLLLPPVKIYARGAFNDNLERLILANSRQPELVRGDMHAQMAATRMGVERVQATCGQFGVAAVMDALAALLAGAAAELRAAIKALPDGEASAEGFMDNDGVELDRPVRFAVTVRVEQGEITFDFTKADRQAKGPINLRPSMVEACVFYSLIGALDPKLHFNDGMREVVRFQYAPDTVTNASAPAPVSSYQAANLKLTDVILQALAPFRPERAVANGGSSGAMLISWKDGGRPGQPSLQYEILGSAYGGGHGNDGASAVATHTSNLHITPIEILETEFPCRIVEFDMVADSAGAGEFRGGLAFRRTYELLQDATVVRRYDRAKFPPSGVAGGKPGSRSRFIIHLGATDEQETPASGRYELHAGERFLLQSAGGGGYGDPKKRDRAALARDMAEGYVSAAAAERDYGNKD
ncbi:MAG TPA: hydantoinase B/oxoprolinase family protein [Xanthobacteraceae bacterium]|nr:hydantoinase B/oxoprolinase family protein [Xanthobacteraceae bacterium]